MNQFAFLIFTLIVMNSMACQYDFDCQTGSRCMKESGNIYGICQGGMNPGNANDQLPITDPLDLDQTVGDTCQFDIDCGVSNVCIKESGYIIGVCISKDTRIFSTIYPEVVN